MQDAALFEKPSSKQLASSQFINASISNGKSSEVSCSISKAIELEQTNENSDEIHKNNMNSTVHMVTNESAQSIITSQSTPIIWSAATVSTTSLEEAYVQAVTSVNSTASVTFHQFSPITMNSNTGIFSSNVAFPSNQASLSSQHGRRAITGHSNLSNIPRQQQNLMVNTCSNPKILPNWNNSHQPSWSTQTTPAASLYPPWNIQQRRSVPNMSALAPVAAKKQTIQQQLQSSYNVPSKFRRSTSFPGQIQANVPVGSKNPYDFAFDDVAYQNNSSQFDSIKFPALENQLLDIMKHSSLEGIQMRSDTLKGKMPFVIEDSSIDDGSLDQTVPNLSGTPRSSPSSQGLDRIERFSRKVFVGGLPPDIDEEEITTAFRRFGALVVDWPHKAESKSYFPPKGYCFLIFQDELSVQSLIESCLMDDDKLYWCVSSPTMKDKPVQIRPWSLSDSDFVMDGSQPLDPRKTIFVGGVPRPLRAVELAMIMDRLYGGVCYAGIDTDPELKYPKGAGRVAFSNQQSYIAAISARFVQLQHGDIDKRVEVKPYVLDDQMCDECHGARCAGKFAPFFCANVTCLQYYCEYCWAQIHSRPGREYHKPLVKEGADRPRAVPFRWC
ncbi:cytoplasmic polyadenylation element-binding protein 2 [Biomphalaria glabrata]|nr:cytoplasmic polyadenylation element-binding protein 2 [Biomphalaria glabrata]